MKTFMRIVLTLLMGTLVCQSVMASTLFKDSFDGGANGDNLTTHAPLTGGTWAKTGIFTGNGVLSGAGDMYVGAGGDTVASYTGSTTHADAEIHTKMTVQLLSSVIGSQSFTFFQGASADTSYGIRLVYAGGAVGSIDFYKFVAGTPTQLGATTPLTGVYVANDVYELIVVAKKVGATRTFDCSYTRNGGAPTTLFGGTITDNSPITGTGHFGIRSDGVATLTTGFHIQQVLATDDGNETSNLSAGTVIPVVSSSTSVLLTGTSAVNGTAPYSYQFRRSADGATGWVNVGTAQSDPAAGVTDSGLTTGSTWFYDYVVTDAVAATATTAAVSVMVRAGTNYFISAAGNDANDGLTTGTPWLTIGKVNSYKVTSGDTFSFRSGDTFSGNLHLQLVAAGIAPTSAAPVTVNAYGGASSTISAGVSYAIWVDNLPNVHISGMTLTAAAVTFTGGSPAHVTFTNIDCGVHATNTTGASESGLVVDGCTITNFSYGILIGESPLMAGATTRSFGYSRARLTNNTVHDCIQAGIATYNVNDFSAGIHPDIYIAFNNSYNIYGSWNGSAGDNSGYPFIGFDLARGVVESNSFHDSGAACTTAAVGGPTGILLAGCTSTVIRANEVYKQHTQNNQDSTGIDIDGACSGLVIEGNYVHDCDGAAFEVGDSVGTTTSSVFRYNICQHNGLLYQTGACFVFGSPSGTTFHNNTFYHDRATALLAASGTNTKWLNNIFIVRGAGATFGAAASSDIVKGNVYDAGGGATFSIGVIGGATYSTLAAYRTGASQETLSGANVGLQATAGLLSVGNAPTAGVLPSLPVSSITAYDPTSSASNVVGIGIDIFGVYALDPGNRDFHRYPNRYHVSSTSAGFDAGSVEQGAGALLPSTGGTVGGVKRKPQ